jgi:hypothetical protein
VLTTNIEVTLRPPIQDRTGREVLDLVMPSNDDNDDDDDDDDVLFCVVSKRIAKMAWGGGFIFDVPHYFGKTRFVGINTLSSTFSNTI